MEGNTIKCKVKIQRQFYPKNNKKINNGDFAILAVNVIEILQGEPKISKQWNTITISGNVCEIDTNEIYTILAKEEDNEKYGVEYKIIFMNTDYDLTNTKTQKVFLKSILSETQFTNLFKAHSNPIQLLENEDTEQLCKVKGIGATTALRLIDKYNNNKDFGKAYVELNSLGLSNKMIQKLSKSLGGADIAVYKIKTNPYLIADSVEGIGWKRADDMALKAGIDQYSKSRVKAFIKYFLQNKALEGNTYATPDQLMCAMEDNLGMDIPDEVITTSLNEMYPDILWWNKAKDKIALKKYYDLESKIAQEIVRLSSSNNNFNIANWEEKLQKLEKRQGWSFTTEQKKGIESTLKYNVVLISGSAGTGKSTTVNGMLEVLKDNYSFAQTALSGKASVNLTDITGEEGKTIHRLLHFNPKDGKFIYNKNNTLSEDIIILDELSMVDGQLFYSLIQAIKNGAKLIMLGDTGQLESIGISNIMQDLIDSDYVVHVNLTKIHRQAAKSAIITDSIQVRNHQQIIGNDFIGVETKGELQDLTLDIYNSKVYTSDKLIEHFSKLLPIAKNIMDIQILLPTRQRGAACTYNLNNRIQKLLINPLKPHLIIGVNTKYPYCIYEGDKVINIKNNYNTINTDGIATPIFNGNIGIVKKIDKADNSLIVNFENIGEILISSGQLDSIQLGYAITVHKSQGSGFKYVICGIDYSHYSLLNKEMVYTMLTRAKKHCVLCAENKALRQAINISNIKNKQTFLCQFLKMQK